MEGSDGESVEGTAKHAQQLQKQLHSLTHFFFAWLLKVVQLYLSALTCVGVTRVLVKHPIIKSLGSNSSTLDLGVLVQFFPMNTGHASISMDSVLMVLSHPGSHRFLRPMILSVQPDQLMSFSETLLRVREAF